MTTRYKILLACVPFSFDCSVVATNKKAALSKAKWIARVEYQLKVCRSGHAVYEESRVLLPGEVQS